jgi:hypothetical protein
MRQTFYTLVNGPMAGVIISAQGHLLIEGFDTSTAKQRRNLTANAACYAWNGPPRRGPAGRVVHANGNTSDCSFRNVSWEGSESDGGDRTHPAACWAVPYEAQACEFCHKRTPYGQTCPLDDRFSCRACITAAAVTAYQRPRHTLVPTVGRIACMSRVEVYIARGSKNAIARKMVEMRLRRAVVHIVAFDFAEPQDYLSVDAEAVIDRDGTLVLKGDVPKMSLALAAGDSYITVAPRRQGGSGRAIIRTASGPFNEVIGGFAAFEAFRSAMRVTL